MTFTEYAGRIAGGTLGYIAAGARGFYPGYRFGARMAARAGMKRRRPAARTEMRQMSKRRMIRKGPSTVVRRKFTRFRYKRPGYGKRRHGRYRGKGNGGAVSTTRFQVNRKGFKDRLLRKFGGKRYLDLTGSGRMGANMNEQAVFTPSQTVNTSGAVYNYLVSAADLGCCLALSDADDPAGPSRIYPGTPGETTRKVRLNWVKQTQTYRNQTNNTVVLHIYDLILRRDTVLTGLNPMTVWTDGLLAETEVTGGPLPLLAFNDSGLGRNFPGATPFQSKRFCQMWKVAKVHKIELHAGSEHVHHVRLNENYTFSGEILNVQGIHGRTYCTMAVVRGGVVNDRDVKTLVGYGTAAVDFALSTRYEVQGYYKSRTLYKSYTTLPTIANAQIVGEDIDAVVAEANA